MTEIPFVDAHVHLWDLAAISYPWLTPPFDEGGPNGNVQAIARNYLLDDYIADSARWNVVGMVHVDAGAEPTSALAETDWLQAVQDLRGIPNGIVAFAPLDSPDVDAILAAQSARPGVRGIRQIVNWHRDGNRSYTPRDLTGDPQWRAGYARLADHRLSFDLQCYPGQMIAVAEFVAAHPRTPVIVNHMGMPVPSDPDGLIGWRTGMRALASLDHVFVKLSGIGFAYRDWTIEQARRVVLETIDLFGVDRCMFASDSPTDKLFGTFDRHLEAYHSIVKDFTLAERRALFGRNANRIYRLGLSLADR